MKLVILRAANGALVQTINPNSATFNTDSNVEREKRLGTRVKPVRQTFDGHSGTITFERETPIIQEIEDDAIEAYKNGQPEYKFELLQRVYYPQTRTSVTYKYSGVCFTTSEDFSEQDSAATVTLNWTSELRVKL